MKIEVTQHDIDSAVRGSATKCPISLALKTALLRQGISTKVTVGVTDFDYGNSDQEFNWNDTRPLVFIKDFDRGRPVSPSTFYYREK